MTVMRRERAVSLQKLARIDSSVNMNKKLECVNNCTGCFLLLGAAPTEPVKETKK